MTNTVDNSGRTLRCGVVGAGVFGRLHAGKYAAHPRAELAGIVDLDDDRARALAEEFGAPFFSTLAQMLEACEAVSVASPATTHGVIAEWALDAGRHALVEKPLASDAQQAFALVQAAEAKGLQLHAGHQERFVARAAGLFGAPAPSRIEARRRGPGGPRGADVSVVMDLMVHDLDLALGLIGKPPASVQAEGSADEVTATVRFEGGAEGVFVASRAAEAPDRATRFAWDGESAELDWVAKTLSGGAALGLDPDFAAKPEAQDSLGANVDAFIASVLDGAPAVCPARQAGAAAALADWIEREAGLRA